MRPGNAIKTFGPGLYQGSTWAFYTFFQDDIQIGNSLTLNLGVRYEIQTVPGDGYFQGLNAEVESPVFDFAKVRSDKNNIAPRFGFSWRPGGADGRMAIRAGAGKTYDVFSELYPILMLPPEFVDTVRLRTPVTGFLPDGLSPLPPPTTPEERRRRGLGGIPEDLQFPQSWAWMGGAQYELSRDITIEARYVGTKGENLPVRARLNDPVVIQPLPQFEAPISQAEADALPVPVGRNARSPDPLSGNYLATGGFGSSRYDAGQFTFRKRFSKGFLVNSAYTYSAFRDNMSEPLATTFATPIYAQGSNDIEALDDDWSRSLFDRPHRWVSSFVVRLPSGDGPSWLTEGWQFSGIFTGQSGQPYTVLNGLNSNGDIISFNDRVNINPSGAPGTVSLAVPIQNSDGVMVAYYDSDPSARFRQLGTNTGLTGNIERNSERTDFNWNLDLTIAKSFPLSDGSKAIEFRADIFNVFNSRQFGIPTDAGNAFGALTSSFVTVSSRNFQNEKIGAGSSRIVQLALRFQF